MSKKSLIILSLVCIFISCISPFLFTCGAICDRLNFTTTGQIGDTIGGITSPVIGIFSIFLLIMTLVEQQNFNKNQARHNTISQIVNFQTEILQFDGRFIVAYFEPNKSIKENGVCSLIFLRRCPENNFTINSKQIEGILLQLQILVTLCCSYKNFLKEYEMIDSEYVEFSNQYIDIVSNFIDDLLSEQINVVYTSLDGMTIDGTSEKSEYEKTAEKLKSKINIIYHNCPVKVPNDYYKV